MASIGHRMTATCQDTNRHYSKAEAGPGTGNGTGSVSASRRLSAADGPPSPPWNSRSIPGESVRGRHAGRGFESHGHGIVIAVHNMMAGTILSNYDAHNIHRGTSFRDPNALRNLVISGFGVGRVPRKDTKTPTPLPPTGEQRCSNGVHTTLMA